jgi:hypothetical protein
MVLLRDTAGGDYFQFTGVESESQGFGLVLFAQTP